MWNQFRSYGSLVLAHGKTWTHKIMVGSDPAVRIPATNVPPVQTNPWWGHVRDSVTAYCQEPTRILDTPEFPIVYIGSVWNAATETTYTQLGIDAVLNCAEKMPAFYDTHVAFYQHLAMVDDAGGYVDFVGNTAFRTMLHQFLHQLFTDAHDRMKTAQPPRKLLVHCVFGRSRSVALTLLILYLWNQYQKTPRSMAALYQDLYDLRQVIRLNRVFFTGLVEFEQEYTTNATFREAWLTAFTISPARE